MMRLAEEEPLAGAGVGASFVFLAFFVGFAIKTLSSRSTPGCPPRTSRRRPPAASCWPACC